MSVKTLSQGSIPEGLRSVGTPDKKMQYNLVQGGKLVCPYVFVHQSVCL